MAALAVVSTKGFRQRDVEGGELMPSAVGKRCCGGDVANVDMDVAPDSNGKF